MGRPRARLLQQGDARQADGQAGSAGVEENEQGVVMARLPRGYTLTNPRHEGGTIIWELRIARWRKAEFVLRALCKSKWLVRMFGCE